MTYLKTLKGAKLSALCFGCMQYGGTANEAASRSMFNACVDAGINFFDTAHSYTNGASEKMLGQFIGNDKDNFVVATKAAYTGGSSAANIFQQFDKSRQRLGFDSVDILYLHRWDPDTTLEETFDTLATLQDAGKVRYIGVSNFAAWQVMKAQAVAAKLDTRIDIIQPMYSLVKRQAEVELFPMAASEGIAVAPYSPLGSGLLTGKYLNGGDGRLTTDKRYAARYGKSWMHDTAEALINIANELKLNTATLAVAWAARHSAVTAPIISARNDKQLRASLDALDVRLSDQEYNLIAEFSNCPAPATDRLEEV